MSDLLAIFDKRPAPAGKPLRERAYAELPDRVRRMIAARATRGQLAMLQAWADWPASHVLRVTERREHHLAMPGVLKRATTAHSPFTTRGCHWAKASDAAGREYAADGRRKGVT